MNAKRESMRYEIVSKTIRAQSLAAVRRRVLIGDVGRTWSRLLISYGSFYIAIKACEPTGIIVSSTIILHMVKQRWTLTSAFKLFGSLRTKEK